MEQQLNIQRNEFGQFEKGQEAWNKGLGMSIELKMEKQKEYYQKNREKILMRVKIYQQKNKLKIKKWQQENKGYFEKWRLDNPEKCRLADKKYYELHKHEQKHIEKCKKSVLNYKKKYPERIRAMRLAGYYITLKDKVCENCGSMNNLQRHHEDYNEPLNVNILCKKCHDFLIFKNIPLLNVIGEVK